MTKPGHSSSLCHSAWWPHRLSKDQSEPGTVLNTEKGRSIISSRDKVYFGLPYCKTVLFAKIKGVISINLCFSDKDDQKGRNQVHRGLSIVRLLNEFCRRLNVTVMKCEKKPYTSQVKKVLWCLAPAWVLRVLTISFCQLYGRVKK